MKTKWIGFAFSASLLLPLGGCCGAAPAAQTTPTAAPEAAPAPPPKVAEPEPEPEDPTKVALNRLLKEPFSLKRRDKWGTLRIPLADYKNWGRVRIWGHPTRATYQYQKDHLGVLLVRYTPTDGPNDPDHCMSDFFKETGTLVETYGVRLGESKLIRMEQTSRGQKKPMLVRLIEGSIESLILNEDYVGFISAYQSWPGTCLIQGFAVRASEHRELATQVRDRWVAEAAVQLAWDKKVKEKPDPTKAR